MKVDIYLLGSEFLGNGERKYHLDLLEYDQEFSSNKDKLWDDCLNFAKEYDKSNEIFDDVNTMYFMKQVNDRYEFICRITKWDSDTDDENVLNYIADGELYYQDVCENDERYAFTTLYVAQYELYK